MSFENFPPVSKIKRFGAGLLAVWMSGVVFLFCCGAANTQAAEGESCPLAKKGHCSKSLTDQSAFWVENFQENAPLVDCCGFLPQLFNKVKKAETNQQTIIIPAKLEIKHSPPVFTNFKQITFFYYHSRLCNRGDTYLKNRVFRI